MLVNTTASFLCTTCLALLTMHNSVGWLCALLATNCASNELFDLNLFPGDWIDYSIDSMEMGCAQGLVWEGDYKVENSMFQHIHHLNANILCFQMVYEIGWWRNSMQLWHKWICCLLGKRHRYN